MDRLNTSSERPAAPIARPNATARPAPDSRSIAWASGALILTAILGAGAKALGVLVAPGLRGVASQSATDTTEILAATLSFTFAGLLVALLCGGAFELARGRQIGVISRGIVVALSGLVVALSSPAVVQRLQPIAALALAVVASIVAIVASAATVRVAHTRVVGVVLGMLALSSVLRPVAWEVTAQANERASLSLYHAGRALATIAVVVQALSTLLAAAWLGTRSRWRGRLLANGAIVIAFGITYLAVRDAGNTPSAMEAMLRGSLSQAVGVSLPYSLSSIKAFLVPASILLALVAIAQRAQPPAVLAALALALLSQGSFDVPLHALAVTAAAQWGMLATLDDVI